MTRINPRLLVLLGACVLLASGWWAWGALDRAQARLANAAHDLAEVERLANLLDANGRKARPGPAPLRTSHLQDVLAAAADAAGFDLDAAAVSIHPEAGTAGGGGRASDRADAEATVRLSRLTREQIARFLAVLQERYGVTASSLRLVRADAGADLWNVEPIVFRTPQ